MTRGARRARFPAALITVAFAISACIPAAGPPASSASIPTSPVSGVVTHVESQGLEAVTGFSLRLADGTVLDFTIGRLENGVEFPPGHLTEHQAGAEPVRVFFDAQAGSLVVTRLEDATR